MSSDLEEALRQAMADHNAGAAPGRSLVRDVKRRHHRRLIRIRLGFAALLTAAAVAAVPIYQGLFPGGSHGSSEAGHQVPTTPPPPSSAPPSPPAPTHGASRPPTPIEPPGPARPPARPPKAPVKPPGRTPKPDDVLTLTYVPHATWSVQPCEYAETGEGRTTTCQWDASEGYWVRLEVIQKPDLTQPEQIGGVAFFVDQAEVHGQRALTGGVPFVARSVRWVERPGVGVRVSASGPAGEELLRVAEGANIPK